MSMTPDLPPFDSIKREIINRAVMLRIGNQVIAIIRNRTNAGVFLEGSSAGAENYSTKPFAAPFGGIVAQLGKGKAAQLYKELRGEKGSIFRSNKSGKLWLRISGGYKEIRQRGGRQSEHANLQWSGRMMKALQIVSVGEDSVTIGFLAPEEGQKAAWHSVLGAGRSRVKRVFVGLSEEELELLVQTVQS